MFLGECGLGEVRIGAEGEGGIDFSHELSASIILLNPGSANGEGLCECVSQHEHEDKSYSDFQRETVKEEGAKGRVGEGASAIIWFN